MQTRIKELRERLGLQQVDLARLVGINPQSMQRFETGATKLFNPHTFAIARALAVAVQDLVVPDEPVSPAAGLSPPGLAEEARPFEPEAGHPLAAIKPGKNQDWWKVTSDVLADVGLRTGDVILVDISQSAVEAVRLGDIVVAQAYARNGLGATTVLREFVAPSLLVTNAKGDRSPSLHIERDDVAIKGVVRHRMSSVDARLA